MIRIVLMRHANAPMGTPDHDRPIDDNGRAAARRVGLELKSRGIVPDKILHSTAQRCRQTCEQVESVLASDADIQADKELYLAGPETIAKLIRCENAGVKTLMVIAHNPGLSMLASMWSGDSISMQPASVVILGCNLESNHKIDRQSITDVDIIDATTL